MSNDPIDFLLRRKSPPIEELGEPAPDPEQLALMLRAATRVPDHGRLEPWRFILYRGEACKTIGEALAKRAEELEGPLPEARLEKERTRFTRAPLVIGVVSCPRENAKIPEWERFLSGGAAAMNLLNAAHALGFGANWISNWYSDDAASRTILGLAPDERVVGFVHVGTHRGELIDRPRPDLDRVVRDYSGPWEN